VIRHLITTDLRRFRWLLAAWAGLVIAYAGLLWATPGFVHDRGRYDQLTTAILLLFFVVHVVPLVLVPVIVQADAAVGSDVFWLTHPIPPRALLAAKAILLTAAVVVLPATLETAAMIASRVPAAEAVRIAIDTLLAATVWLAVVMAASAITATFPRFALLCASAVVALAAWIIVMTAITRNRMQGSVAMLSVGVSPLPLASDGTKALVLMLGLVVAGSALLLVQYQRRQRLLSVPAGGASAALAILLAGWWPWPLLTKAAAPPEAIARSAQLAATTASLWFPTPYAVLQPDAWRAGRLTLHAAGIAPDWVAAVAMRDARVTLSDGTVVKTRSAGFLASPPIEGTDERPERVALRHLFAVDRLVSPLPPQGENVVGMVVTPAEYQRLTPAAYHGEFALQLSRLEIAGIQPLRPGAAYDGGVYQLALKDVAAATSRFLRFNAIETRATSLFDPGPAESYTVYAVNRARSQAIQGTVGLLAEVNAFAGFSVHVSAGLGGGYSRHGVGVDFSVFSQSDSDIVLDEEWMKQAELVVVRTTALGSVPRTIDIPLVTICTAKDGKC